jgi:hypothetical protein
MLCAPCSLRFFVKGAVAQLGERHVRNVQVGGSIPLCSTKRKGANSNGLAPFSLDRITTTILGAAAKGTLVHKLQNSFRWVEGRIFQARSL